MTLTVKHRILSETSRSGVYTLDWTSSNNGFRYFPWAWTYKSRQVTKSEGHAWPKDRGIRDAGGDFDTIKLTFRTSAKKGPYFTNPLYDGLGFGFYSGDLTSTDSRGAPIEFAAEYPDKTSYFNFCPSSGEATILAKGTEFVAQSIPTNSIASASVSLAELYREGLPSMIGAAFLRDKASFFRSLGSEYLNLEFGWKPLVNDLKAAAKAVIASEDVLKQLQRDSGRDVHRRRYSPTQKWVANTYDSWVPGINQMPGNVFSGLNTHREVDEFERTNWFSGCFTYHYDPGSMSELERMVTQARILYGIELTPEVLWNLAPWSWLVDWVSNVGPVLHNLSAFQSDGLVMRYGYVMEFNSRTRRVIGAYDKIPVGTNLPHSVVEEFSGIRKLRRRATPYGFGLDIAGFSTRQWAILAALGITKAPRVL